MRAGDATAAANAKVPDRLFKRHGRWRSESAKDGYVKDSVESRLQVSQRLGLYLNIIDTFFGPSSVQSLIVANLLWCHNSVMNYVV